MVILTVLFLLSCDCLCTASLLAGWSEIVTFPGYTHLLLLFLLCCDCLCTASLLAGWSEIVTFRGYPHLLFCSCCRVIVCVLRLFSRVGLRL